MLVEEEIARLASLSSAELKDAWRRLIRSPVPRISPSMMRLALAWEIQARAYGGHSREVTRKLEQIGAAKTNTAAVYPGMRLVREWQGKAHVVTIGEDQVIRWNEREWRSLFATAPGQGE